MHAVFRIHQRTVVSFRVYRPCCQQLPKSQHTGQPMSRYIRKLGPNDQLVEYIKPMRCPRWMSQVQYDAMPASITVRDLRYQIHRRGFRTRHITLATTLLDPETYPADSLTQLYGDRWQIEVDFRHLKTTMGMEVLHCKTVVGVMGEMDQALMPRLRGQPCAIAPMFIGIRPGLQLAHGESPGRPGQLSCGGLSCRVP